MYTCFLSAAALPEYTRVRVPDDHAIADLAMYNYVEVILFSYSLTNIMWNCSIYLEYKMYAQVMNLQ